MNCLHKHGFNGDPKLRYRMFKSGKTWVFATTAMFALVAGTNTLVRADQVTTPSAVTAKIPATHTNPPIKVVTPEQSATSNAGQSNQTISDDSTRLHNNGYTDSENKAVKAAKQPTKTRANSVPAKSVVTSQPPVVQQPVSTVRTAQPASSVAVQSATAKATYQNAVSQANQFAQTATSQAKVVDQYAKVVHDPVTKTKIHQAKQYAAEAQTAADLTKQYASLAAVNLAVMTNSTATTSYDAAIDQMTLALNATSSYTAQVLSAAAAAEQAAVTAMRQTANHTYLQFGQVADTASSAASQVMSLTNQAKLVAQTDPDSQAIATSVDQINQSVAMADQAKTQLKQAWLAAQTANQALQQADFGTVQTALSTLQTQANTASQAEQQLQQATNQAGTTLQDLTNLSKAYAGSHAHQVAMQASQAVTAIQLELSQAQTYHGEQAKQYASAINANLELARSQANLAGLKAAAVQASYELHDILSQSREAVAAAAIATEQLKEAQQATKLAQQFDTDVKNEQTDHDGAHILLSLSQSQVNINQSFIPNIKVKDLGGNWGGPMSIHGDLTYTWYQSTDGETWRILPQQVPIKLAAAGKYYLQVVIVGYKWNVFNNVKFKAASNVVAVVVNDQDGGNYQQQAEQALVSATATNAQYAKIKQAATQAYQQAQQLLDMSQQTEVQVAYQHLTQQFDQVAQTYQQVQAKKAETDQLMATNDYAQAKLAAQAAEKLATNLTTQVATATTTWQQVQTKLENALTAAAKQQSTAQVQHYLASSYATMAMQAAQVASQAATKAGYANANIYGLAEHTQLVDPSLSSTAQVIGAKAQQASSMAQTAAQAASLASQAATTDDYQLAASQLTIASSAAAQLDQILATLNPTVQQAVADLVSKQSKYYQNLVIKNAHIAGDAEDAMLKAGASVQKLPSDNTVLGSSYAALTQSAATQTSQAFQVFNQATVIMNSKISKVTAALKQGQYSEATVALSEAAETATAVASLADKTQQAAADGQKDEQLAVAYSNEMSPVFDGRGDAGYAFGIVMVSGMTTQPAALTSTRSGNVIHLSASSRLGLGMLSLSSTGEWQVQVHHQWMKLSDASRYFTFHEDKHNGNLMAGAVLLNVSNSSSLDVTLAPDFVGSLIFQWKADYSTLSTASNLAEVDVYDKDIPATGLTIAGSDYIVYSQTQATQTKDAVLVESQYTTQTTPGNATGEIHWQSNHPEIATIDDGGMLTVSGPGTVELTATITNADGTTYQAKKSVVIGNGLSDQTATAGSTLHWQPDGLENVPSDQVTYQWYMAHDLTSAGQAIKGATQATLTLAQLKLSQTGYYYLVVTGQNTTATNKKNGANTPSDTVITLGRAKLTVIGAATTITDAAAEQMQLIIDNAKHYQVATTDYAEFTTTYAKQHTGATDYANQAQQAQAELTNHKATLATINQQVVDYQQQAIAAENAGNNTEAASLATKAQACVASALKTQTKISSATNQARSAAEAALKVVDPVIPPTEVPGNQTTNKPKPTVPDTGTHSDHDGDNGQSQTPSTGTPGASDAGNHATETPGPSNPDDGNSSTNGAGQDNPGNQNSGTDSSATTNHTNTDDQSGQHPNSKPGSDGTLNPDDGHHDDNDSSNSGLPNQPESPNTDDSATGTPKPVIPGHTDTGNDNGQSSGDGTTNSGTTNPDTGDGQHNSGDNPSGSTTGTPGTANPGDGDVSDVDNNQHHGSDQSTGSTTDKPTTPNPDDHATGNPTPVDPGSSTTSGTNDGDNTATGNETNTPGDSNSGDDTKPDTNHDNSGNQSGTTSANKPGTVHPDGNHTSNPDDGHTAETPGKPGSADHATGTPTPGNDANSGTNGDSSSTGNISGNAGTANSGDGTNTDVNDSHDNGDQHSHNTVIDKPGDDNQPNTDNSHNNNSDHSSNGSAPDQSGTSDSGDGTTSNTTGNHNNGDTPGTSGTSNSGNGMNTDGNGQSNGGTLVKPEIPNTGDHATVNPAPVVPGQHTNSGTDDHGTNDGQLSGGTTGHETATPGGDANTGTGHDNTSNESGTHAATKPGDGTTSKPAGSQHNENKPSTGSTTDQSEGPNPDGHTPDQPAPIVPAPGNDNHQSNGGTTETPGTSTSNGDTDSNAVIDGNKPGTSQPGDDHTLNPDGDNQSSGTPNTDTNHNNDDNQSGHEPGSGSTTKPDDGNEQSNGETPAKPETPKPNEPGTTHSGDGTTSNPDNGNQSGTHSTDKPGTDNTNNAGDSHDNGGTVIKPGDQSKPGTAGTPNSGDGTNPDTTADHHSGSQAGNHTTNKPAVPGQGSNSSTADHASENNTTGSTTGKPTVPTDNGQKPDVPGPKPVPNPIQPTEPDHHGDNQSETDANQAGKPDKPADAHPGNNASGTQHVMPIPGDDTHAGATSPQLTPSKNTDTTSTDSSQSSQQGKPVLNGNNQQTGTGNSQTTVSHAGGQITQQPKPLPATTNASSTENAQLTSTTHWVKPVPVTQNTNMSANKPATQQQVKSPVITGITGWRPQTELATLMSSHPQSVSTLVGSGRATTGQFNLESHQRFTTGTISNVSSLSVVNTNIPKAAADFQQKITASKSAHVANQVKTGNTKASVKPAATGMAADHLQAQHRQAKSVWPRLSTWLVIFFILGLSAWATLLKTRRQKSTK